MKEVPLIDVFDTTDFNPELILSSVLSDPTLDFVTNADELNDNIMIPDMLQHLGNPVFFSQNIICMNNNNNDNLDGSNQQLVQNLPNNQQQNQHLQRMAAHQTSNFKATRVHTAAEKFTDKEMDSFEVELTRQISSSLLVAKGAQTAQQQSPAIGPQQQQQQQNCKCEFCEYLQANRISLTGDHSFQCEFCGEGFSNQTSFNQHRCGITDIHLFRCENCHRDYNSSRVSYSFGNAEQRNKCDLCDQSNGQTHSEGPTLYSSPQITVNATTKVKNSPPSEAIKSNTRTEDTFPMLPIVDGPIVSTPFLSPVIPSHHVSTGILSEHNAGSPQCTDNNSSSQHVEIGVGTFVSDSKRIGDFLKRVEDNFNEFITTPTIVSKTNRNNNISLTASSSNHVQHLTESSKTYFVLENSDQIQQFQHNRPFNNSGTSSINSTANNFRHIISTPIPNQHHPAQTRPLYPGEHGVTSLQQYDQYDDEDYSSMSEDEAIVPREPYAESPNQENAKTELPIQETVVDTSSSLLQFESVENGLSIKKNVSLEEISKKADSQKNLNQDHPQFEEQQHKISSIRCTDNNESGKCDSSSSFEKCSIVDECVKMQLDSPVQSVCNSTIDRPYKCNICERSYRNQKNLKSHLKVHEGIRAYQCEICGKNFSGSSYLVIHRRRHTGERPFKCTTCGKAFVDSRALSVHTRLHSGERLKCEKCEKTFSSVSALTVHNRLHTGIHPYKCDLCDKTFPQYNNLKHHMKKHDASELPLEKQSPRICGNKISNTVYASTIGMPHHPVVSKKITPNLSATVQIVASSNITSIFEHKCHICSKLHKSTDDLQEHLNQHNKERPNQCEFCSKVFPRSSHLIIHRRRHTGERPFKCKYCDKAFVDSRALSVHTRLHTGERVKCEICEKTFASSSGLIVHRRIHTGVHPYKCEYCEKSFAQSTALKYHLKKHETVMLPTTTSDSTGGSLIHALQSTDRLAVVSKYQFSGSNNSAEAGDRHKCLVCNKHFRSSEYLVRHRRTHSGERPYQCETCGKHFSTMSYLVIHRRRHTSEKPYKCNTCEKAFVDSRALQEHVRLHTGDRVRCEICQKTYSSVSNLIVHRRIHSGIHPFECESCGKSFAQKNALKYHLKKHTKHE